jgi:CRP-like cAMP-binding protein
MVSPELLRRYHFSAGISQEKIVELAKIGKEIAVEAGHYFFQEGEKVDSLYLVVEGEAAIILQVPDREANIPVSEQLAGEIATKDVVVNTVGAGATFGWAAIVPPSESFNSIKASKTCQVVSFDAKELKALFETDYQFAYEMSLRAGQIMREQFRDLSIEILACVAQ